MRNPPEVNRRDVLVFHDILDGMQVRRDGAILQFSILENEYVVIDERSNYIYMPTKQCQETKPTSTSNIFQQHGVKEHNQHSSLTATTTITITITTTTTAFTLLHSNIYKRIQKKYLNKILYNISGISVYVLKYLYRCKFIYTIKQEKINIYR